MSRSPRSTSVLALLALLATSLVACEGESPPKKGKAAAESVGNKPVTDIAPPLAPLAAAKTPSELKITFSMPRDLVSGVAMGAIGFSEPMVPVTALNTPATLAGFTLEPAAPLRLQWISTDTLAFYPTTDVPLTTVQPTFPGATTWKVTLGTELVSVAGRKLAQPYTFSFKTAPPSLVASSPAEGAESQPTDPTIFLYFDQRIAPESVTKAVRLMLPDGTAVPVKSKVASGKDLEKALIEKAKSAAGAYPWMPVPTPSPLDLAEWSGRVILVAPTAPLPLSARVEVRIESGIRSLEGPDLSEKVSRFAFTVHGPFQVKASGCDEPCRPDSYALAKVEFTTPLAEGFGKKDLLTMTPMVKDFNINCWGSSCNMSGAFTPGGKHTVTVPATMTDSFGQKLGKPHTFSFEVGHYASSLDLETSGTVLELGEKSRKIGFTLRNVDGWTVRAHKLSKDNLSPLVSALANTWSEEPRPVPPLIWEHTLKTVANDAIDVSQGRAVDLVPALGGADKPGLVVVESSSPQVTGRDNEVQVMRRIYQVTDLHLGAKVSAGESIFWITSYATGKGVEGVQLEIQGSGGRVMWTGTTNTDGLATGPGTLAEDKGTMPVLIATKGADLAFLSLEDSSRIDWGVDVGVPYSADPAPRHRAFLFTDKDVYRLGETAHLKGIVRTLAKTGLALPAAGRTVEVTVIDPADKQLSKKTLTLSAQGTFHTDAVVPATGAYGSYTVRAVFDGETSETYFRALVYRAPKFRSSLELTPNWIAKGDKLVGKVSAGYYTGGPMVGAPVEFNAYGSPADFSPPGWDGFSFGMRTWDDLGAGAVNYLADGGKGQLDAQGQFSFPIKTDVAMDRPLKVDVEAIAQDPNGRPMSATSTAWLHPAAVTAGVSVTSSVVRADEPTTVRLIAVDPNGLAVAGSQLQATLLRREWRTVRVKSMGDEYMWQTNAVDVPSGSCTVASAAEPVACTLTPAASGYHMLVVTAKDKQGRTSKSSLGLWAYGKGEVTWNPNDEEGLLIADKKTYHIGETAKILVKNPVPGSKAIVTEERDGILRSRLVTLGDSATTLEIPIEARHQPNFFVSVLAFAPRRTAGVAASKDTGAPSIRLGYVEIAVDSSDRKLQVEVKSSSARARPGQAMEVVVQVKNAAGQPRPSEVTVFAVDEGVLALTGRETPDPMAYLYAPVALGVRNYATIDELVRNPVDEDKGETGGGGGEAGGEYRSKFRDVAFWEGALQTDSNGRAIAKFTLPDNLTTYRIMAVAIDGPTDFGNGEATLQVDKPLMLLTSVPNAARVGDKFEAALTVRNTTDKGVSGQLALGTEGALAVVGVAQQALELKAGESREFTFRVHARVAGAGTLFFRATPGPQGPADAADAVQETVPVVDPKPLEAVATYGIAQTTRDEAFAKATGIEGQAGGLHITTSATGAVGLEQGIEALIAYPYGCTEQVASQLLALLYVEQFNKQFRMFPQRAATVHGHAEAALAKLMAVRRDGGFSLWPDETVADAPATAWALMVLHDASQRGYAVDPAVFQGGATWLRGKLASDQRSQYGSTIAFDAMRALMLAALSTVGQPAAGYLDELYGKRATLPPSAALLLAQALLAGDGARGAARAAEMLDELTKKLHVDGETSHLVEPAGDDLLELWPSEVRTNAMLLNLMVQVDPGHPLAMRVGRWLIAHKNGDPFSSTQDNAWALKGLARWFSASERQEPDFAWGVFLGDKRLATGAWQQRTLDVANTFVPQADLPGGLVRLQFQKKGSGALYYGVRYEYAPTVISQVGKNAGFFVSRSVNLASGAQAGTLKRGDPVLVTLYVLADAARPYVAIVDRLPAGLEPVDFDLATGSRGTERQFANLGDQLLSKVAQVQSSTAASSGQLAGNEVRFFVNRMPQGLHMFTYVARAAVRGQFTAPGAKAEATYRPEVFGTSAPTTLTIE
ncbi:MAG: Ig-like domain-containing protein [Myxococcota bacterium]